MRRLLNLSTPGYMCPEGDLTGGASPIWGYRPSYNAFNEVTCKERPISDIMGYYELKTYLLGPFPGELFSQIVMTSKPHTTNITYSKESRLATYDPVDTAELRPEQLVGRLNIVDITGSVGDVTKEALSRHDILQGDILFLRTDISAKHRQLYPTKEYYTDYPGITFEAAEYLISKGVKVVGIDARDIEPLNPDNRGKASIIRLFNDAGIPVVQDLANLGAPKENHDLAFVGVPVKIAGMLGGPARVVALDSSNSLDYVDLSFKIKTYPSSRYDRKHGWMAPLPRRIEPRDIQNELQTSARLLPFILESEDIRTPDHRSQEMYMYASHGTNTHAECAFFDPFGVHNVPEEIMCRFKEMPLDRMIGPACLMDLSDDIGPRQVIDVDTLERNNADIRKGDALFVRTEINDWYMLGNAMDVTPGFTLSAANWLVDKGIRAIVIDFTSVERSNPPSGLPKIHYTANDVHYKLHCNDIPVIERTARLGYIRKQRFNVAMLPFPAHNLGGFPIDIFAWEDWN